MHNGFLIEPRSRRRAGRGTDAHGRTATYGRGSSENVRRQNLSADEEIRTRLLEIYRRVSAGR